MGKGLDAAVEIIKDKFGKAAIMKFSDTAVDRVPVIPSMCLSFDIATGIGGIPRRRISELFGPTGGGKTTLALHVVASAQRMGLGVAYIDSENALDETYARYLGVDTSKMFISQPDNGEQGLEIAEICIRSGEIGLVVVDSVDALVPIAMIEGEMGDRHVGLLARLMSQAMRKLSGIVRKANCALVLLNQERSTINTTGYAQPATFTSGGVAVKYYSSMRVNVKNIGAIKGDDRQVGQKTLMKIVKNKCIAAGSMITDPISGISYPIEEIVLKRLPIHVLAMDNFGLLRPRRVIDFHEQGMQDVVGVQGKGCEVIYLTKDHLIWTDNDWQAVSRLSVSDSIGTPFRYGSFGEFRPFGSAEARLLGYLLGDGYTKGLTNITLTNTDPGLLQDATRIAMSLGCEVIEKTSAGTPMLWFKHRIGDPNEVLNLCKRVGLRGATASEKRIPEIFFDPAIHEELVAHLLAGYLETDGHVSAAGLRACFFTTSEQLARQAQLLLLKWSIKGKIYRREPRIGGVVHGRQIIGRLPAFEVRVNGLTDLVQLSSRLPLVGTRTRKLLSIVHLARRDQRDSGSAHGRLTKIQSIAILQHLAKNDISISTVRDALDDIGNAASIRHLLGGSKLRRDRVTRLGVFLRDNVLISLMASDVAFCNIRQILPSKRMLTYDLTVEEDHNLIVNGVIVHNCAPPFKTAEVDLIFGQGLSLYSDLLDLAIESRLVDKAGAWYSYGNTRLGNGRDRAAVWLSENEAVAEELRQAIRISKGLEDAPEEEESNEGEA